MKIFFDGGIFGRQKVGGISRVGFELMRALVGKKDVEQSLYRGFYIDDYPIKKEWFKTYYGARRPNFFRGRMVNFVDNIGLNVSYAKNGTPDVIYHSFYYRVPAKAQGPVVVHCHDMISELSGDTGKSTSYKKKAFDAADLIICVSESTRKDLFAMYPHLNPAKVVVVPLGASNVFFNAGARKILKRPYLLYVGARSYPHKNFDFLLNAFIEKKYFLQFDLVLMGGEKELTPAQQKKVRQHNGGAWLRYEFGSDEYLADLYASATAFIYPSLYEGFGIPPLEAMAAGCPVVASNSSSIPESVGDAGLLFDPRNSDDLAEKIDSIINNKDLAAQLIEKGKARARRFTWEAMAQKIYEHYKTLAR